MQSEPLPQLSPEQERLLRDNIPLAKFLARKHATLAAHNRLGCSGRSARWLVDRYYDDFIGFALDRLVKAAAFYDPSRCDAFGPYAGRCIVRRLVQAAGRLKNRRLPLSSDWRDMGLENSGAGPAGYDAPEQFTSEIDCLLRDLLPARWAKILKRRILGGESYEAIAGSQRPAVDQKAIADIVRQAINLLRARDPFMRALARHASYKVPLLDSETKRRLSKSLFC